MYWNSYIPQEKTIDSSTQLMREGYLFISNRSRYYHSDIFQIRLLGQKVYCMTGKHACEFFYDKNWFTRIGAAPKRIQKTLFGENGVQTLDGQSHEHRKHLFMSLLSPDRVDKLTHLITTHWHHKLRRWTKYNNIILFYEAQEILCRAACEWTGVPIQENEVASRAQDFTDMIDAFGAVGPRHWRGRQARKRTENWIQYVIERIRNGQLETLPGSAAHKIAYHRDLNGNLLQLKIGAVELMNVIRPIVAIATFITFAALALHQYPEYKMQLQEGRDTELERFVQEVRRFYPFGPFLGARVRQGFIWNDRVFKTGTLVLLDIYGTNHDPRLWDIPHQFQPSRFKDWKGNRFDFIPQGGGDYYKNHRCPGEHATIEAMKATLKFLVKDIEYDVPAQNLYYSLRRMPSIPESRFIMTNVRPAN